MSQQPPPPQSFEQVLRQSIRSLNNADDLVKIGLILNEIAGGMHNLEISTGAIWEKLDDDRAVSARSAERVKRWCKQVRSQLDAMERQMDKYQP